MRKPGTARPLLPQGTNTGPCQPVERDHALMREILAVLWAVRHPVGITTRGTMTGRDIDLIAPMAAQGPAAVPISGTTPDVGLARKREPRAPAPRRRLPVIERLARAGIPVRIQISPLIPAPTGHELEAVMQTGRHAGATAANCSPLRLPPEVSALFREWPEVAFPARAARIMGRARELHGGCHCDPRIRHPPARPGPPGPC
ncbi:MAG: radical SAM protein [Rhodobacter sp.]|nr:radical SAM protein [Rhodobacter sp.]